MKRVIIVITLFFAGIYVSEAQEKCDTLKWKILKTYYTNWDGSYPVRELDNAVINMDTLPIFYPDIDAVNVSNDTFFANERVQFISYIYIVYLY